MNTTTWSCPKCGCHSFEVDELRGTGSFSRFFDIQNKKFTCVTCEQCRYTELYKAKSGALGNVFDFFTGG